MKNVFLLLATCIQMYVYAQTPAAENNIALKMQTHVLSTISYPQSLNEILPSVPAGHTKQFGQNNVRAGGETIGNTSYDLPTNRSAPERLHVYSDGKVSAVWTGSTSTSSGLPDRGTFINTFDGSTWNLAPDTRIESYRTGFPTLISVDGKEMFFAHDGNNNIVIFENEGIGSTTWNESPNSLMLHGTWPRAFCADGSSTIHLLAANDDEENENDYMLYYRSTDGGVTWNISEYRLPGIDTVSGYNIMGAECYVIRAIDNTVFIAAGNNINDLAIWKSESNGDIGSWTRTRLFEFPVANFDGNNISDLNGDLIADTLVTHDGNIALAIDKNGMMHVWAGVTYVLDQTMDDAVWTYFPGVAGMWYWNENFGADSLQLLNFPLVDWEVDDDPFSGIGIDLPNYGCGFTSQAAATIDPITGNIYVVYTHQVEFTDYGGDPDDINAQSFRDLFGFYSSDYGNTWSTPINLSYVAEGNFENVNPSVYYNTVSDKVHVLWMQDMEPGNSLETESFDEVTTENYIIYRAFDFDRFEPYNPSALFDYTQESSTLHFNNLSVDASDYIWDFNDGDVTVSHNPTHTFEEIGTYTVCLTAMNKYGENIDCKTVEVTDITELSDFEFNESITVYPTLTSDELHIQIQNWEKPISLEIYSINGGLLQTLLLSSTTSIEMSKFGNNVFTLRFISDNQATTKRVVVQK